MKILKNLEAKNCKTVIRCECGSEKFTVVKENNVPVLRCQTCNKILNTEGMDVKVDRIVE